MWKVCCIPGSSLTSRVNNLKKRRTGFGIFEIFWDFLGFFSGKCTGFFFFQVTYPSSHARKHFASAYDAEKQENHCSLAQTWPIYTCFISTNQRKEQIMDVDLPRTANILSTLGVCGVSLLLDDP